MRPLHGGLATAFDARAAIQPRPGHRGPPLNTESGFWSRFDRNGPVVRPELGPCWLWTGRVRGDGHCLVSWGGPEQLIHRVAYSLVHGAIGPGVVIRHRCDVGRCGRPDHLVAGTIADNNADARERGRANVEQLLACAYASRGTRNVNAKLNDDTVRALRSAWRAGESIKSICARTGLTVGTVHPMLHGKTWRHVVDLDDMAARPDGAPKATANLLSLLAGVPS